MGEIVPIIEELKRIGVKDDKILIVCIPITSTNSKNPFRVFHYKHINFDNPEQTLKESL